MEGIKTTDLMIRNYVLFDNIPMYVVGLYDNGRTLDLTSKENEDEGGDYYQVFLKEVYPIPLTENILIKCGFEKEQNYRGFLYKNPINGFRMRIQDDNINVFKDNGRFRYAFGTFHSVELNYLHQLQNLFKILTGNDLKVNL
ncbi:MAG: hypothetical protein LBQ74_13965 [Prevotella sp.]|jgi:hypothetical protein|nr:hypothetical protein [Prevotella sp.]